MKVTLPALPGPIAELWPLLLRLAEERQDGWSIVGAQMVTLHASHHGVRRPLITEDVDVVVDIRTTALREVAAWFIGEGFELATPSTGGTGHRFVRGRASIDLLAIDHYGRADLTTIPPMTTVAIAGGRRAIDRSIMADIATAEGLTGSVPVPDWLGAVLLKARAAITVPGSRSKHLQDLALLLGLPTDVVEWSTRLRGRDRTHLRAAGELIDEATWRAVAASVRVSDARSALEILTRPAR
jgi:hypothetical protein